MSKIYIYTGPVHSGKTTQITRWIHQQPEVVHGILAPDDDAGVRYLQDIETNKLFKLSVTDESDAEIVMIGRYQFLAASFAAARKILYTLPQKPDSTIIIDEIGPLELRGEGLEPSISLMLKRFRKDRNFQMIWIVRDSLINDVISHYRIENDEWEWWSASD